MKKGKVFHQKTLLLIHHYQFNSILSTLRNSPCALECQSTSHSLIKASKFTRKLFHVSIQQDDDYKVEVRLTLLQQFYYLIKSTSRFTQLSKHDMKQ